MNKIIFISIIAVCFAFIIFIFVKMSKELGKLFKISKITTVDVACAGSSVANTPRSVKIQSLGKQTFPDQEKKLLNPDHYRLFIVRGLSMLLCNIRDNDILFTLPVEQLDKISFDRPSVLVLKRDKHAQMEAVSKNDQAKYKVRRTWAVVRIGEDDLEERVKQIMKSEGFRKLKNEHPESFQSDEEMLEDFKTERITKYMNQYPHSNSKADDNHVAIISTTLRTSKNNKVFFSIHPARIIIGEVIYSFHKQSAVC